MKEVTKDEMFKYISDRYDRTGRLLHPDHNQIYDPPATFYCDLTLGTWPGCVVAQERAGQYWIEEEVIP